MSYGFSIFSHPSFRPAFSACRSLLLGCTLALLALLTNSSIAADEESSPAEKASDQRRDLHLYMKGRALYQKFCVDCHGTTGRGNGPWAVGLEAQPRNFRSGLYKFRTTKYGTLPVDADLERTIRSGISGTAMPVFANLLDDEMLSVIYYLKSLSRAWKDPAQASQSVTLPKEAPTWLGSDEERKSHLPAGAERYRLLCAVCHGESGKGDGPGGTGMMDAWEHSIRPAALAAEHHKSGDSPLDLYRTIATGLNGTPMIGFADALKEQEIWELVAWIDELGKQAEARGDRPSTPVIELPGKKE